MWINKEGDFHYRRFHLGRVSSPDGINNVLLILHCKSHWPLAKISKWSHLMLWPVEIECSVTAEAWPIRVRALKCSVFVLCNLLLVLPMKKHHNPSNWFCRQSSIPMTGWNDLYKERKTSSVIFAKTKHQTSDSKKKEQKFIVLFFWDLFSF